MNFKAILDVGKATFKDFGEDKVPRLAAALAYYTIFSIGPLLLIAISVAGLLFGEKAAQGQIVGTIGSLVGQEGAKTIQTAIEGASKPGASIVATIIGIITLLFGASGVFGQLKDALNTIWEVKPKEGLGIIAVLRDRFLSFTMVLGTGFLLLVSLVISAGLSFLGKFLGDTFPGGAVLWNIINYAITLLIVAFMFALLFKFLPDVKIGWKDVAIGALITSLLFIVGQIGLGIYLGTGSVGTSYGAAGSIVVLLVWIYYSSLIMFIGAEFTQAYTKMYGSQMTPAENAEPITEEARAQQGIPHKDGDAEDSTGAKGGKAKGGKSRPRTLKASPWFR